MSGIFIGGVFEGPAAYELTQPGHDLRIIGAFVTGLAEAGGGVIHSYTHVVTEPTPHEITSQTLPAHEAVVDL